MIRRNKKTGPEHDAPEGAVDLTEVVHTYATQAQAAADLAEVDTTHLDTPTANPNALQTLNTERDTTAREKIRLDYERERMTLQADHARQVDRNRAERRRVTATDARADRAINEGLADADQAAAQLATIRQFEAEASPAAAATDLTRQVRTWRREEFVNAIIGSALSAVGISSLLVAVTVLTWWTAPLVAAAAEVVLTMRVVRLISQRATLAERHKGRELSEDGRAALVFMQRQIFALLAVSVLVNVAGLVVATGWLGLIGVLGSVSAAVASWSAARVSVAATATVRSNVSAWQGQDWEAARQELRSRAAGAHIPTPEDTPTAPTGPADTDQDAERLRRILAGLADEQIAALADRGTDALAVMLNGSGEGGTPAVGVGGTGGGTPPEPEVEPRDDQQSQVEPLDGRRAVLEAITCPENGLGAEANNSEIGRRVGLSRTAVRKHRTALWADGEPVFPPGHSVRPEST